MASSKNRCNLNIESFYEKFQKLISLLLLMLGMFFVLFQTIELFWEVIKSLCERIPKIGLNYAPQYAKTVSVLFFNILLSLEILETIKIFSKDHEIKIRIILLVCLIAVSRKILVIDTEGSNPISELATAALVISLSASYYIVKDKVFFKENIGNE